MQMQPSLNRFHPETTDVRPGFLAFLVVGLALLGSLGPAAAQDAPVAPANPFGRKYPARVYQTARLDGKPPVVDGRIDDEAWKQGEWASDYRQFMPTEGARPSQPIPFSGNVTGHGHRRDRSG